MGNSIPGDCYLVHRGDDQTIESHLVFSNMRLSLLGDISICRLELMVCIIRVTALMHVERHMKEAVERKVLWSDSKCAYLDIE